MVDSEKDTGKSGINFPGWTSNFRNEFNFSFINTDSMCPQIDVYDDCGGEIIRLREKEMAKFRSFIPPWHDLLR
jgi:hypothetical protein